jgi:hypothetical protein
MARALVLATLLLGGAGFPGYKHVGGKNGVEVYRLTSSPVIDLVAEGDFDAPPSVVQRVILDYDHSRELSDRVAESRVLARSSGELTVYQRLDLPVVSDRDYTLRTRYGARGELRWTRSVVDNTRGPQPRQGVVRVPTLNGGWDLAPTKGGTATHAVYRVQIDMAGAIPMWMVSGGAAKDLPKLFEGVRKRLRSADVANANTCITC